MSLRIRLALIFAFVAIITAAGYQRYPEHTP